jgi:hypothetical protein
MPLVLHRNQLIALCDNQPIDVNTLLTENTTSASVAPSGPSQSTLVLSPAQIAHLIHQHKFDMPHLMAIEKRFQKQDEATNPFHFTSSQLAYLMSNERIDQPRVVTGLTASQLLGLFALQQPVSFSISYSQVEQLALQQRETRIDRKQAYVNLS